MDTASRLLFQVGHQVGRISIITVVVALAALALALAVVALLGSLAQPSMEPLISAPLRW